MGFSVRLSVGAGIRYFPQKKKLTQLSGVIHLAFSALLKEPGLN